MSAHDPEVLGLELIELANALLSVRILADIERCDAFATPSEARLACRAIAATAALIGARLAGLGGELADALPGAEAAPPAGRTTRGRPRARRPARPARSR